MSYRKIGVCTLTVSLLAATCMYAINVLSEQLPPMGPPTRILFIAGGASENWLRTVEGARAAAKELDVELHVQTPTADDRPDEQMAMVREIDRAEYDGVAFCPTDMAAQLELINELAERTKLITVGKDERKTNGLCHVGFCQECTGRVVAILARGQLKPTGRVVALSTVSSDVEHNARIRERLDGFKDEWGLASQSNNPAIVSASVELNDGAQMTQELLTILSDPEVVGIVAFDAPAAELALAMFAQQPRTEHVQFIAFDPTVAVLDAIDDGRVDIAIHEDAYRDGYEAVKQLARYCRSGPMELPAAGQGNIRLCGEAVHKTNLADFRRRTQSRPVRAIATVATQRR
jgi:ribose transport system substrate-binding protein